MTLEEAIEHCKEVAKESREAALSYARANAYETAISCKACGQEHEQIAEWLTELKQRREADITALPKSNGDRIRQMSNAELAESIRKYVEDRCDFCTWKHRLCDHRVSCKKHIAEYLDQQEVSEDACD